MVPFTSPTPTAQSSSDLPYPSLCLNALSPGPIRASVTGIVANIIGSFSITSQASQSAQGCMKLLLVDATGDLLVKLFYVDEDATSSFTKSILLGSRITIHVTHISPMTTPNMNHETIKQLPSALGTSLFPERDRGCKVEIHDQNPESTQLGLRSMSAANVVTNIIPLQDLFARGSNTSQRVAEPLQRMDNSILACVINVGEIIEVRTKTNDKFPILNISIVDLSCLIQKDTLSTTCVGIGVDNVSRLFPVALSLSMPMFHSATKIFQHRQTILYITNPKLLSEKHRRIKLTPISKIFVVPSMRDITSMEEHASENSGSLMRVRERLLIPSSYSKTNNIVVKAEQLRRLLRRLQPSCNIPNPGDMALTRMNALGKTVLYPTSFDTSSSIKVASPQLNAVRKQYTLALVLDQIHQTPLEPVTAYISVLLTSVNLVELFKQCKLFCMPCSTSHCESIVNANAADAFCMSCGQKVKLRLNPQVLAGFADETGGYGCGIDTNNGIQLNLEITDEAWRSLIGFHGHEGRDFTAEASRDNFVERLLEIEELLRWQRVTFIIQWVPPARIYNGRTRASWKSRPNGDGHEDGMVILSHVVH